MVVIQRGDICPIVECAGTWTTRSEGQGWIGRTAASCARGWCATMAEVAGCGSSPDGYWELPAWDTKTGATTVPDDRFLDGQKVLKPNPKKRPQQATGGCAERGLLESGTGSMPDMWFSEYDDALTTCGGSPV